MLVGRVKRLIDFIVEPILLLSCGAPTGPDRIKFGRGTGSVGINFAPRSN